MNSCERERVKSEAEATGGAVLVGDVQARSTVKNQANKQVQITFCTKVG